MKGNAGSFTERHPVRLDGKPLAVAVGNTKLRAHFNESGLVDTVKGQNLGARVASDGALFGNIKSLAQLCVVCQPNAVIARQAAANRKATTASANRR